MLVTKRLDLALLQQELAAASIVVSGLGTDVPEPSPETPGQLFTYNAAGTAIDLPPEAAPVVEAHVAPPNPFDYAATVTVHALARTTDDTPTEIWRYPCGSSHVYVGTFTFMATDPAFNVFEMGMRYVWKRASNGAVFVGEAPLTSIPEPATADWNVQARVEGNDFVVEVIGERTGTGDWLLYGEVGVLAPGGLA